MTGAAALAVAGLVAGGCGGGDGAGGPHATLQAAVTTAAPATTVAAPPPTDDDPEFGPIWRHIEAVRYRAYTDPDPGRPRREILAEVVADTCECFESEARELDELDRAKHHWVTEPPEVLSVRVLARPGKHHVLLRIIDRSDDPGTIVDLAGTVVGRGETRPPTKTTIQLIRIERGWVVLEAKEEGPVR